MSSLFDIPRRPYRALFALGLGLLFTLPVVAAPAAKHTFSDTISITPSVTLEKTGSARRKILFFSVYSVAHYSSSTTSAPLADGDIFDALITSPGTKQMSIVFERDLKAKKVQKTLTKGVNANCVGDEWALVEDDLNAFKKIINRDVKKGDEFDLRWTEAGSLQSIYADEIVGEVNSPLLARLLWQIWLGDHAVVNRNAMVERLKAD